MPDSLNAFPLVKCEKPAYWYAKDEISGYIQNCTDSHSECSADDATCNTLQSVKESEDKEDGPGIACNSCDNWLVGEDVKDGIFVVVEDWDLGRRDYQGIQHWVSVILHRDFWSSFAEAVANNDAGPEHNPKRNHEG